MDPESRAQSEDGALDDFRDCAATGCKRIAKYEVGGKWYCYVHSRTALRALARAVLAKRSTT